MDGRVLRRCGLQQNINKYRKLICCIDVENNILKNYIFIKKYTILFLYIYNFIFILFMYTYFYFKNIFILYIYI